MAGARAVRGPAKSLYAVRTIENVIRCTLCLDGSLNHKSSVVAQPGGSLWQAKGPQTRF